ncbi:uncharacterized protein TNCV_4355171 [Trichonephila clavipes]|nr:uncharacterized protein TNCV_4355171 [Trichonephila clavipes]
MIRYLDHSAAAARHLREKVFDGTTVRKKEIYPKRISHRFADRPVTSITLEYLKESPRSAKPHRQAWLAFAKMYVRQPTEYWENVIFVDENKYNIFESDGPLPLCPRVIKTPAQIPDLIPIENVWDYLQQKLNEDHTSSSPLPLKTRCVGQRCTLNLSRAETSSRWCGVVVRRRGCQLRCRPRHLTVVQNYVVRRQKHLV